MQELRGRMQRTPEIIFRMLFAVVMIISLGLFGRVVGLASPWFGVIGSFCVLGLFDLATPPVRPRLPRSLRQVRSWESRGDIYRALGVRVFGVLLRRSPLRLLNRRVYLKTGLRELMVVRFQIENAEGAHFWGGLLTIPYLALAWVQNWWSAVAWVVLFNIVGNLYPILHLRAARARIDRALRHNRLFH